MTKPFVTTADLATMTGVPAYQIRRSLDDLAPASMLRLINGSRLIPAADAEEVAAKILARPYRPRRPASVQQVQGAI